MSHACVEAAVKKFRVREASLCSRMASTSTYTINRMMTPRRQQSIATAQCAHLCTRPERYAHEHRCSSIRRRRQGLLRTIRPQRLPAAAALWMPTILAQPGLHYDRSCVTDA